MHSHTYRKPEQLQGETVLVIGAGPSGKDITIEVASKAKQIFFSHHRDLQNFVFPSNVKQMPDIKRFNETNVEFIDDTIEEITAVLFCTGTNYIQLIFCFLSNYLMLLQDTSFHFHS